MGPLDQLLAIGADVVLGDTTYRATPLTLEDWAEVEDEIRVLRPDATKAAVALAAAMEPAERKEFLTQAYNDARQANIVSAEEMLSYKRTLRGQCHIVWLSLRKAQNELTRSDVAALVELTSREVFRAQLEELRKQFPDLTWEQMIAAAKDKEEGVVLEMVMRMEAVPEGNP